jgi:hypothetical protein
MGRIPEKFSKNRTKVSAMEKNVGKTAGDRDFQAVYGSGRKISGFYGSACEIRECSARIKK